MILGGIINRCLKFLKSLEFYTVASRNLNFNPGSRIATLTSCP